jgi:hypothetical protein
MAVSPIAVIDYPTHLQSTVIPKINDFGLKYSYEGRTIADPVFLSAFAEDHGLCPWMNADTVDN